MSARNLTHEPSPERARRVAATLAAKTPHRPKPIAEDVALLLDLRKRVEGYLDQACQAWMKALREDEPHVWAGSGERIESWDAHLVRYSYLPHSADYDDQRETLYIPVADVLPEFSAMHAAVTALSQPTPQPGSGRS